jgi:phage terminase large subunit-like protein
MTHAESALDYARRVIAGEIPACKLAKQACARHLSDLTRSKGEDFPYYFNESQANRVCKFVEMLPHNKGKWAANDPKTGKPFRIVLEPWQRFIFANIFGWVKKTTGKRRFTMASIYVPRKNGKSLVAAALGWWMFAKDDEPGAEVYSGANSEKQAWEVFKPAREIGRLEPDLVAGTGTTLNAKSLVRIGANAKFEPVIGKPGDGASPHLAIIDEFHESLDSTLYDTMKTGMGAREQPLILVVSTAGENLTGPCRDDWNDCEKILSGVIEDETHFCIIYSIDEGTDWTTEEALRMANPNWGVSVNPEMILPAQQAAIRDASKQAIFKTKHLNMWVSAANGWLNLEQWKQCGDPSLDMAAYAGQDCWIGLDAASKIDLTSMVATFRNEDGGYSSFAKHYIPEETVALPQNAHYRKWVAEGWLISTPGARVDFTIIEDELKDWADKYNIQQLGFDPKELNDFTNRVGLWSSFARVEIPQGPQFMSEPMKEMEALIATGKYRHQADPVFTWQASNVVKKEARGGGPVKYYYPTKLKPENKIDAIVAGIMALRGAMTAEVSGGGFSF